jgi:uncharacterized protein YcnI
LKTLSTHPARTRRLIVAGALALTLTGLTALPASAHVRVRPDSTASGGYAGLTFRVPNESDTASTTKLVLTLPQDKPFSHVSVKPVPGWTATVAEAALPSPVIVKGATMTKAVHTITWAADKGAAIAPGQYQEFSISAGPLPAPGALALPVAQIYSDGEVVRWDEPTTEGGEEPAHPAPQFEVAPADGSSHAAASGGHVMATVEPAPTEPDTAARALAGGALVVALLAAGAQLVGARRRARSA